MLKMDPHLFPTSFLILVFMIFILIHAPRSVYADDERFTTCRDQLVQCGNLPNMRYPFWGGNRPEYCGHPGFNLSCQENVPRLTIRSRTYRVLDIDNTTQTLTVALDDFWNNICPKYLYNATLDSNLFSYTSNTVNFTLYYGCPLIPGQALLPSQFSCSPNGTATSSYYAPYLGTITIEGSSTSTCSDILIVHVFQTAAVALTTTVPSIMIGAALDQGFELRWQANDTICSECVGSGGRCGYDLDSNLFTCYCADQPYTLVCNGTQSGTGMCP
ncbi:LEAF RUST 10 DISEASE-RESISTANCE LOCUS RECEPTOR-LIKE PROTEIN KINASE-like 2.7 [Cornus florida]|uniref:LEAF RUST 10 DISEASE-RESISTANCE LOCUS RECEPTOR-LIKE PROTEIN KINASE-like 2.7 n=1 Tax=Cornus florida TaxID=4283 RepID=UPI00289C1139|nr:LEAF RUST 10 DISEASE-RESISTANCE LOCUS RECEPTOR-LIKE PROTEIN KINASE-like 2.7 [Cornus florida]